MKSHFQSIETAWTSSGFSPLAIGSGLYGSRACEPYQATPPSTMIVSIGIDQTTSSSVPLNSQSGR